MTIDNNSSEIKNMRQTRRNDLNFEEGRKKGKHGRHKDKEEENRLRVNATGSDSLSQLLRSCRQTIWCRARFSLDEPVAVCLKFNNEFQRFEKGTHTRE